MRQNPERLAWTALLSAFVIFCLMVVGCPLSVRSYLLTARQGLHVQLYAQQGTVRVERNRSTRVDAVSLDDPSPIQLFKGDGVRTGALDEGLVILQKPTQEDRETLGTVVVYDDSDVRLKDAYTPRFGFGSGPHKAILQIKDGRARIELKPASDGRPVQIEIQSDHTRILLSEGSYVVQVTNQQTTATVHTGQAQVRVGDQALTLTDEQRAVTSSGTLEGPLPAEHDLIVNSDFDQSLDVGWIRPDVEDPTARLSVVEFEGEPAVWFQHDEVQPLEIPLFQTLNRNVRGFESLVLHLKVRINFHSLSVCGMQGSECPVMVRIDYIDAAGGNRQWVHGFYTWDDPTISSEPYYCLTCPEPLSGNHDRVPEQTWFLYDSPNLMDILPQEARPAIIQSVRVYASGHSYDSLVADVELLAQE